jgi:hypothetical protein
MHEWYDLSQRRIRILWEFIGRLTTSVFEGRREEGKRRERVKTEERGDAPCGCTSGKSALERAAAEKGVSNMITESSNQRKGIREEPSASGSGRGRRGRRGTARTKKRGVELDPATDNHAASASPAYALPPNTQRHLRV